MTRALAEQSRGHSSSLFVHKVNHELVALAIRKIRERRLAEIQIEVKS